MKYIVCISLFSIYLTASGQRKFEIGASLEFKKGIVYGEEVITNTNNLYKFATGFLNPQLDILISKKYSEKVRLYTGLAYGRSSHFVMFDYPLGGNNFGITYKTKVEGIKIPFRFGYNITKSIEIVSGFSLNYLWEFSFGEAYGYRANSTSSIYGSNFITYDEFSKFFNIALVGGFQVKVSDREKLFALVDCGLLKYPMVGARNTYQKADLSSPETVYEVAYRPRILQIGVGYYYRIY